MQTCSKFIAKFTSSIVAVLGCFDRLLFKGYLPFGGDEHLNRWVDLKNLRRKDFIPLVNKMSEQLVEHAKNVAQNSGRKYLYLQGRRRKETLIDKILREEKITSGLIAVLCCVETCRTVKLRFGKNRPWLQFAYRPQRVLYYYWLDERFGRIHIRIQTWFPFTIQIYLNGHDWLARQMERQGIGFVQRDNAFTQIDDPQAAQKLSDRFEKIAWQSQLDRWARMVNPLLRAKGSLVRYFSYRRVIDQAEYSTDILSQVSPGSQNALPSPAGSRGGELFGSGHSHVPRSQDGSSFERGDSHELSERPATGSPHQTPDEK